ncbi:MAG: MGH1-like glycoside hydrolase domain-containing protein, partial [Candidatus Nanopelagicales bacterium]
VVDPDRLRRVLLEVLSEDSMLSPYGLRSVSKRLEGAPYQINVDGQEYGIDYEPAESTTPIYGGNSNWRGPVWFPINHLVIEALERYHLYLGDDFTVECPTGSGVMMNLSEVAAEIRRRLIRIFEDDADGRRPVFGGSERFQGDPRWHDPLFYEYFHGDNGAGLGASHQTGWTGLVADLIIGRKG